MSSDYRPHYKSHGHIESKSPWDVLNIDILGLFSARENGERFVLSVMDCFSRYIILIPLKKHTA